MQYQLNNQFYLIKIQKNIKKKHVIWVWHISKKDNLYNILNGNYQFKIFNINFSFLNKYFFLTEKREILKLYPDVTENLTIHNGLHSPIKDINNDQLHISDKIKLMELNKRYKEKFGFPFIICPKDTDYKTIFSELISRLQNCQETEIYVAMREVKNIVRMRIHELVDWFHFCDWLVKLMTRICM